GLAGQGVRTGFGPPRACALGRRQRRALVAVAGADRRGPRRGQEAGVVGRGDSRRWTRTGRPRFAGADQPPRRFDRVVIIRRGDGRRATSGFGMWWALSGASGFAFGPDRVQTGRYTPQMV